MRIFITGGTGYVGGAVTAALVAAGHEVFGLVRTPERAGVLKGLGAEPVRGSLDDPTAFLPAAARCHAVVHLAQAGGPDRAAVDASVVRALLDAARGSQHLKTFVYTSVLFVLGDSGDGPAPESPAADPPPYAAPRAEAERRVLEAGGGELACAVIRPGMVYGGGAGGSVSELFRGAVEEGAAAYVGGGGNRWSLVHRDDAAELYRMLVERRAGGIFHVVDGHPLTVREVAGHASRAAGAGGRTKSVSLDEARGVLGAFADALCLDQVADASRARALGWVPRRPDFASSAPAAFAEWEKETAGRA